MPEQLTVKKITAKGIGCNKIGTGFRIIGRVVAVAPGKTQYGDFARLRGAFEAQTFTYNDDGEVTEGNTYRSGIAIMPPLIEAEVLAGLQALQDENATASMEIAYDVKLVKADNPMGKEWAAQPLIKPRPEQDPLRALRLQLAPPEAHAPAGDDEPAKPKRKRAK